MKTWKDIRGEILRLGAQSEARYEQDPMLFVEAVNRAACIVAGVCGETVPEPLTGTSADGVTLSLSTPAMVALPLLAAFYVYEDEDERKAVRWREDAYEILRRVIFERHGSARLRQGESV